MLLRSYGNFIKHIVLQQLKSWRTGAFEPFKTQWKKRDWFKIVLFLCFFLQIDKAVFEQTIAAINSHFVDAEKIGASTYVEGCLGCLTAYLIYMCMTTHYSKVTCRL